MKARNSKSEVELTNVKPRPIEKVIIKKGGDKIVVKMNDDELVNEALSEIDAYIDEHHQLPPLMDGKFIQWLRECKEAAQSGEDIVRHKRTTVSKTIPDYRLLKNVSD